MSVCPVANPTRTRLESGSSSRLEPAHDLQQNFDVHMTLDDDPVTARRDHLKAG